MFSITNKKKLKEIKDIEKAIEACLCYENMEDYDMNGNLYKGSCQYKGGIISYILDIRDDSRYPWQIAKKIAFQGYSVKEFLEDISESPYGVILRNKKNGKTMFKGNMDEFYHSKYKDSQLYLWNIEPTKQGSYLTFSI